MTGNPTPVIVACACISGDQPYDKLTKLWVEYKVSMRTIRRNDEQP
jgi:hypothetical protein